MLARRLLLPIILAGLTSCGLIGSPVDPACTRTNEQALALLDDFARCQPGTACQIWSAEPARTLGGACVQSLACFAPVRADANLASLTSQARAILDRSTCLSGCANVDCATPEMAEAYCDPTSLRCRLRLIPRN